MADKIAVNSTCIIQPSIGQAVTTTVLYDDKNFYTKTPEATYVASANFSCIWTGYSSAAPNITEYIFPSGLPSPINTYVVEYPKPQGLPTTVSTIASSSSSGSGAPYDGSSSPTTSSSPSSKVSSGSITNSSISSSAGSNSTGISNSNSSKRYDSGTVAGAAIGSAIGAATLAALITLLCLRRRRNSRRMPGDRGSTSDIVVFGKGGNPQPMADDSGLLPNGLAWMKQLPQSADDNTIAMRVKTLYNNIELHAENFYQNIDVRGTEMTEDAQEALLDLDTGLLPSSLPTTLLHSPSKMSVIKHALSHLILVNISTQDPPKNSFLPDEYVGLIRNLEKDQNINSRPAFSQCLSHYRVMTSYLRPDHTTDQAYLKQRESKISRAATTFTTAFEAWGDHRASSLMTRKQNLIEIMRTATDTGIFLFSQPAAFEFRWEPERQESEQQQQTIATLPSFVKTSDDRGNRLDGNGVMIRHVVEHV